MAGFVAGTDRGQSMRLPQCLDDWVDERNPIRVIDAFVDAFDLWKLGFDRLNWKKKLRRRPERARGRSSVASCTSPRA
jgi:hypothetical protein